MITVAAMIGIASSVAGLYVSYAMNLASGAAIVLMETLVFAGALTLVTVRNRMRVVRAGGDQ
jgi:ABC-type Mn2+/Zn2+ transport system permease subunit